MKMIALIALTAGALFVSGGCSTPAYTPTERHNMIARDWDYDLKQATDDWDYLLLFRPASRLTMWDVR